MIIGDEIKAIRLREGISICELERRSGVSKAQISNIERGKADECKCKIQTLIDIVEAMDHQFVYYITQ